jgi:hypothetical protein
MILVKFYLKLLCAWKWRRKRSGISGAFIFVTAKYISSGILSVGFLCSRRLVSGSKVRYWFWMFLPLYLFGLSDWILLLVLSPVFINGNSISSLFEGAAAVCYYCSSVTFIAMLIHDLLVTYLFLGYPIPIIIRGLASTLLSMFLRHPYLGGSSSILGESLPGCAIPSLNSP